MTLPDRCPYYATDPYWTRQSRDDNWRCGQIRDHLRAGHVLYSADGERILDQSVTGWEKRGEHARPYDPKEEHRRLFRFDTQAQNPKHRGPNHPEAGRFTYSDRLFRVVNAIHDSAHK